MLAYNAQYQSYILLRCKDVLVNNVGPMLPAVTHHQSYEAFRKMDLVVDLLQAENEGLHTHTRKMFALAMHVSKILKEIILN